MARQLRIEYPGAVYHLTARGNRREEIFLNDQDRLAFLEILEKTVGRFHWICHAYCLMDNHYHLLIETPEGNLSSGMRQLNGVYTQKFNWNHNKVGHVFQGRYKSILVEKETHLLELCRYIVANPVKAGKCSHPGEWSWSSYNSTCCDKASPDFLSIDWVLGKFSKKKKTAKRKYCEFVENGLEKSPSLWEEVRGQVLLGSQRFVDRMREYLEESKTIDEIPRSQRIVGRPSLPDLFPPSVMQSKKKRNTAISKAHRMYFYTMNEIGKHLGIHYSTVSRVISKIEKV